jgi:hypothetical protein
MDMSFSGILNYFEDIVASRPELAGVIILVKN